MKIKNTFWVLFCLFCSNFNSFGQQSNEMTPPKFDQILKQYWSPDGNWFAYSLFKEKQRILVVESLQTKEVLVELVTDNTPLFSEDGGSMLLQIENGHFKYWNLLDKSCHELDGLSRCQFILNGKALLGYFKNRGLSVITPGKGGVKWIDRNADGFTEGKGNVIYYKSTETKGVYSYNLTSGKRKLLFASAGNLGELFFNRNTGHLFFSEKKDGAVGPVNYRIDQKGIISKIDIGEIHASLGGGLKFYKSYGQINKDQLLLAFTPEQKKIKPIKYDTLKHVVWNSNDWGKSLEELSFSGTTPSISETRIFGIYDLRHNIYKPLFNYVDSYFNPQMLYPEKGRFMLRLDNSAYASPVTPMLKDVYLYDFQAGAKKMLIKGFSTINGDLMPARANFYAFSPDGTKLCYFHKKAFWMADLASGECRNMTDSINDDFYDLKNDTKAAAPSPGEIIWDINGNFVYLHSAYDVYRFSSATLIGEKLTDSKFSNISYKISALSYTGNFLDGAKPLILEAKGKSSGYSGWFKLEKSRLRPLVFCYGKLSQLTMAVHSPAYSYLYEKFDLPPQLIVVNSNGKSEVVYDSGPGYKQSNPGKSELINYRLTDGTEMKGALYYPFNYNPLKKYPMVVYVYERMSQHVHDFPAGSAEKPYDVLNFTRHGYFVFTPDIRFKIDSVGFSATECVKAGVTEALKNLTIDKDNIGLMGHSWGGYETSFIVSQTNMFKAGIAGAAVTDMVSMYLSLRWEYKELSSAFLLFEQFQARFSGPFYNHLDAYIRNSPVHHVKTINTPLLLQIGNRDGVVDWTQGTEFFNALRRLGKPATLLVYNKEGHLLSEPENIKDYAQKQLEFFGYYLKGERRPDWLQFN